MQTETKSTHGEGAGDQQGPEVHVVDLNTNRAKSFHASWADTLQHVWDTAYNLLKEARRARDEFECQDGKSLMSYLVLTLRQYHDQHVCAGFRFQIKGETGGAMDARGVY